MNINNKLPMIFAIGDYDRSSHELHPDLTALLSKTEVELRQALNNHLLTVREQATALTASNFYKRRISPTAEFVALIQTLSRDNRLARDDSMLSWESDPESMIVSITGSGIENDLKYNCVRVLGDDFIDLTRCLNGIGMLRQLLHAKRLIQDLQALVVSKNKALPNLKRRNAKIHNTEATTTFNDRLIIPSLDQEEVTNINSFIHAARMGVDFVVEEVITTITTKILSLSIIELVDVWKLTAEEIDLVDLLTHATRPETTVVLAWNSKSASYVPCLKGQYVDRCGYTKDLLTLPFELLGRILQSKDEAAAGSMRLLVCAYQDAIYALTRNSLVNMDTY